MLVVPLFASTLPGFCSDGRFEDFHMENSMSSRRSFSSQLAVEDFCVCLLFRY
jgi:hypothetical protein